MVQTNLTGLALSGADLPPWSANGVSESLAPEEAGSIRRTVWGTATSTAIPEYRKYRVSISCEDVYPPSFDAVYRGQQVVVDCVSVLVKTAAAGATSVSLGRTPVSGSVAAHDEDGNEISVSVVGSTVSFASSSKKISVSYRPQLTCLVDSWSEDRNDFGATTGWSLELVEV
jgi:hypothetical protein